MRMTLHTDGGARGNPGPAGIGYAVYDEEGTEVLASSSFLGEQTNNFAEYEALIRGLFALKEQLDDATTDIDVVVKMDSELVVRQLNGIYKVKHPDLQKQFMRVRELQAAHFPKLIFTHVRREQNKRADELANEAMDRKE